MPQMQLYNNISQNSDLILSLYRVKKTFQVYQTQYKNSLSEAGSLFNFVAFCHFYTQDFVQSEFDSKGCFQLKFESSICYFFQCLLFYFHYLTNISGLLFCKYSLRSSGRYFMFMQPKLVTFILSIHGKVAFNVSRKNPASLAKAPLLATLLQSASEKLVFCYLSCTLQPCYFFVSLLF